MQLNRSGHSGLPRQKTWSAPVPLFRVLQAGAMTLTPHGMKGFTRSMLALST